MVWPPELADLKSDMDIEDQNLDTVLQTMLDAAVSFVERVRPQFNYTADPLSDLPEPTADHLLGTIRLARRWNERRKSPDALIDMGALGSARIPSFDPDIEKLLRIGRWAKAVVG